MFFNLSSKNTRQQQQQKCSRSSNPASQESYCKKKNHTICCQAVGSSSSSSSSSSACRVWALRRAWVSKQKCRVDAPWWEFACVSLKFWFKFSAELHARSSQQYKPICLMALRRTPLIAAFRVLTACFLFPWCPATTFYFWRWIWSRCVDSE